MTLKELDSKIKHLQSFNTRVNKEIIRLKIWVNSLRKDF